MNKLHLLRTHLVGAVPSLTRDPDRLLTFVEEGSVEFRRGRDLSHEYRYAAQLVLTDFADELDTVMLPLLQWLAEYQPDVDPNEAVSFEAEILNNRSVDLALRVSLTERVIAKVDCEVGTIRVDRALPRFEPDTCPATHWKLLIRHTRATDDYDLIAEWGEAANDGG
ncbi:phage tail protein [Halomonas litopenaei]|uniref:phage tail protein n=1 Tax=Halomonas litopenaei TaxID=2109328 RepID=UPI003F9F955C